MNALRLLYQKIEKNPQRSFLLTAMILFLYQLLGVFYGFELCDSGFYLTFYDNFFSSPESVQYNFMYYLSGLIGGLFNLVVPGLLGMRLVGLAFNMVIIVVIYNMLKGVIPTTSILVGVTLVVFSYISPVYTFSYDICTSLLYVLAICCVYKGIVKERKILLFVGGIMVGLNIFSRIPNVLAIAMIAVVVVTHYYAKVKWSEVVRQVLYFIGGVAVAVILMLAIQLLLGHLQLFFDNIRELREIAAGDGDTSSHSVMNMILSQLQFYGVALRTALKYSVVIAIYILSDRYVKNRILRAILKICCVLMMARMLYLIPTIVSLWVICVAGGIYNIFIYKDKKLFVITSLGLFMLLVFPLGSDSAYNNGSLIAWVAAPMASVMWIKRHYNIFIVLFLLICSYRMVSDGAYFDGGNLLNKTYTIDNDRTRCIFTTKARAEIMDKMLSGIEPYVQPGDTLLAYGSIATVNYLTHTQPYISCSWPEQLSAASLSRKLNKSHQPLPKVLRQKFNTIGMEWGNASERYLSDYDTENVYLDNRKNAVINRFLQEKHYKVIYEDSHFVLYSPVIIF